MSNERYSVSPAKRVEELLGDRQIASDEEFSYSFSHGNEKMVLRNSRGGGIEYSGSFHPGDGTCHTQDGRGTDGICIHCGMTLL